MNLAPRNHLESSDRAFRAFQHSPGLQRGAALWLIGCVCACGSEMAQPTEVNDPAQTTPPPSAAGTSAAPAVAATTPATNTGAAAQPMATATTAAPAVTAPAAAPSDPTIAPAAAAAGGTDATAAAPRYPDACAERRGSWATPCSDDPDPCGLKSGYPGDNYCLLPPPAGQGIQIHFGPKNYTDTEVAPYLMKPGDEFNSYAIVNIPTTEEKWFSYMKLSMRPGSHHVINNLIQGQPAEGFVTGSAGCDGTMIGSFPGTQNLILESPPQGIPAPENEGLGRSLPANSSLCQNYHRYNNTDAPSISEIWYNIWFADPATITQKALGLSVSAGPFTPIPAHTMQTLTTTASVTADGRVISLFGHRHASTTRFVTWLNGDVVYDSWDWVEARLFNYDSITQNPPVDAAQMVDGATSGIMNVKKGDQVKIECDVNNTSDASLHFANELYTGEMCILFGSSVGATLSGK
jgi:hypothetical protein